MEVFGRVTRPVLDLYPQHLIHRVDATMSQIRVLKEIVTDLVPLKEAMDGLEMPESAGVDNPTPKPPEPALAAAAKEAGH
jgi:hypothetical protein